MPLVFLSDSSSGSSHGGDSTSSGDVKRRHQSSFDPSYWSPAPNSHNGRQAYWAPNDQIYISSPVAHSIPEEPSLPLAAAKTLHEAFTESDQFFGERRIGYEHADRGRELMYQSDGRDAASLLRSPPPPVPPPLCSICRHKAPVFGKPPRWFSLGELEEATGGFSEANFVSEGGFGWVHRGLLPDGRVVAVKTLKTLAGPKANDEFRAEVEVLSRAQHRNVVLLLGFCVEGPRRVLVYEYVCNGSLAVHLHGKKLPSPSFLPSLPFPCSLPAEQTTVMCLFDVCGHRPEHAAAGLARSLEDRRRLGEGPPIPSRRLPGGFHPPRRPPQQHPPHP